jgi:hypothetical protein
LIALQVEEGRECGVNCDGFDDWVEGDMLEAFLVTEKRLKLEDAAASKISLTTAAAA